MSDDVLIMGSIAYTEDAELDVEYDGEGDPRIQNHDELVNEGKTVYEYRALHDNEQNRSAIADSMIVEEGDSEWREEFADWEVGDTLEVAK